ncbi:sugar-binding transcriptional regulator [Cytobacillus purgationiresistens]|uniref:Central glycolytic genes regulator n=1 Tax=Cytobacillus purgationiresistens TaxID=863449 RepID=A0ABU0AQ67_9BACI|nr:sugar-binding domain-containing protein [Cytobacillus purgationiresistens]MDQ0273432.1 central glycolytic genes regulator [Cytobacillus purgationiresistens]
MGSFIEVSKRVLPDLLEVMQTRYDILRYIVQMEPVGRRSLAASLEMTERVLRSEVDFLKEQRLVQVSNIGMSLTEEGREILFQLGRMMKEITGINIMEKQLAERLGIQQVILVSGDADKNPAVKKELGNETARLMESLLGGNSIIAVTGGSTMASVSEVLTASLSTADWLFVPARGGIGAVMSNQANTICSKMAERTNAGYRTLYVPDQVSTEMYQSMIKEPAINEVLQQIRCANMVLHGIGDAMTMAERRESDISDREKLKNGKAVGEAFGYYFNESGEVVHKVQTIGLQLEDLSTIKHVIAVAGGYSKAKAIASYMKQAPRTTILITDEGAAHQLLDK